MSVYITNKIEGKTHNTMIPWKEIPVGGGETYSNKTWQTVDKKLQKILTMSTQDFFLIYTNTEM